MEDFGIHFLVGLTGTTLEKPEADFLAKLRPAGIILFLRNIEQTPDWPVKLHKLIQDARDVVQRPGFVVSIDHEGGRVHRLMPPVTQFPPAVTWREHSKAVGRAIGSELRALGFNLNFAPVLDVLREPTNRVIGERAFSNSPTEAARFALEFLDGMESEGVLGCGKHFPGHGATVADSHLELPICSLSRSELESCELIPFKEYLKRNPPLMMTAHVLFPKLDTENPGTVSWRIISGLLRKELGFRGAVISDALEMGAMSHLSREEMAIKILRAGGDLLMIAQPPIGVPAEIALSMKNAIADTLTFSELSESRARISNLLALVEGGARDASSSQIGSESHQQLCALLSARLQKA